MSKTNQRLLIVFVAIIALFSILSYFKLKSINYIATKTMGQVFTIGPNADGTRSDVKKIKETVDDIYYILLK